MSYDDGAVADPLATEDLARRAQNGDVGAFDELVARHLGQIRRLARAFARDDLEADDLAQEALIKVYRSLGRYRFEAAFATWLFTVIRSCFLDARKSRQRHERGLADVRATASVARQAAAQPDQALQREQERQVVWAAIAQVPADLRTALVLCDVEGMAYDEVAAIERVPLGTVKSRLHRARGHLRHLLSGRAE